MYDFVLGRIYSHPGPHVAFGLGHRCGNSISLSSLVSLQKKYSRVYLFFNSGGSQNS